MSYRIEEKIPVSIAEGAQLINRLKKIGLERLYPSRKISSSYFDNENLDLFRDSEEGLLPRKKLRLRCYPNHLDEIEYSMETKISSVEGRFKTSKPFVLISNESLIDFEFVDCSYGILKPVVEILYLREYYFVNGIRITLDSDIRYKDLKCLSNYFFEERCVIELKAPDNTSLDFLISLIHEPRRRFSKYCNAIKFLNLSY